jgi:hypothetical protein
MICRSKFASRNLSFSLFYFLAVYVQPSDNSLVPITRSLVVRDSSPLVDPVRHIFSRGPPAGHGRPVRWRVSCFVCVLSAGSFLGVVGVLEHARARW